MPDNGTRPCETIGMVTRRQTTRKEELLDELLKEYEGSSGVTGDDVLLKELTRAW